MRPSKDPAPKCPCPYEDCDRHADCEACRAYHHGRGQKTCCEKLGKQGAGVPAA